MPSTTCATDALTDILAALPPPARTTDLIRALAEGTTEPDYWLRPLKAVEAAAFLGMAPGALATAR